MGLVESEPGPAQAPAGWQECVETGTLTDSGRLLLLKAATPSGRRAINDPGDGAPIPLEAPLSHEEAMEGVFDVVSFGIHIGRIMLRAARDGGIILFTLRAPRDPEPHHILSVPAQVDDRGVMRFHLGTLQEMEGGAWDSATHQDGMALLDLTIPYSDLVAEAGPTARRDSTPTVSWKWPSRSFSASSSPASPSPWAPPCSCRKPAETRAGLGRADVAPTPCVVSWLLRVLDVMTSHDTGGAGGSGLIAALVQAAGTGLSVPSRSGGDWRVLHAVGRYWGRVGGGPRRSGSCAVRTIPGQ